MLALTYIIPKNKALSAPPARLGLHLILQTPANRTNNLTRLGMVAICQTEWRMVQAGAIRSPLEAPETRVGTRSHAALWHQ